MNLVTVKTFDNLTEAHILKTKLESEGIRCYMFDENIVALNPFYNIPVGGIKVKIAASDVLHAEAILSQLELMPMTNSEGQEICCPQCRSSKLYAGFKSMKGAGGILTAIVSFLFAVFPFYFKTLYRCKGCGHEFKEADAVVCNED